jgi:ABC-type glutathione transport system ATPase component
LGERPPIHRVQSLGEFRRERRFPFPQNVRRTERQRAEVADDALHVPFALESVGGSEDPDALLERVGLDREDADRPVGDYSNGMYQRLAMAMTLVGDPI